MSATTDHPPTPEERERAAWRLLNAQIAASQRAAFWEPYKAIAAVLGAAAFMFAAWVSLANWRSGPQPIIVQFQQPLAVKVVP